MNNKSIIKIIILVYISLIIGIFNVETVFNDCNTIVQVLLSLLGLCLTAYTFILVPVQSIVKEKKEKKDLVSELLKEYKDNMICIFISCLLLISIDLIFKIDIPCFSNPLDIDFGLFKIYSLKAFLKIFLEDLFSLLSLYSFYDIMKSIFILVNSSLITNI